jgi:CRISPR type III-A-associated RAMP protein Csm4
VTSEDILNKFIASYSGDNFVRLSSAFPYRKGSHRQKFFPKPLSRPLDLNRIFENMSPAPGKSVRKEYLGKLKKFKKNASLLEEKVFFRFLKGELDETSLFLDESLWIDSKSAGFKEQTFSFNTIDRLTNDTSTDAGNFYEKDFMVSKEGGLFFIIDGPDDGISLIESALRFFNHTGFGGDSTTGKNLFSISVEDYEILEVSDPNAFISLSLYRPDEAELESFQSAKELLLYETVARKGKAGGNLFRVDNFWKDSLLMFREGSVFPLTGKKFYGKNTEMKKFREIMGHTLTHYGISFHIPMKLKHEIQD